jgi:hypothetical protein
METTPEKQVLLDDVWQKIPPEEKLQLLAKAQSTGISTVFVLLMFTASIAVGFKSPWTFWGSFFAVPFVFQMAAAKAWRLVKPKAIVEYTAARATASIYANQVDGHNLNPTIVFKGSLERAVQEDADLSSDTFVEEEEPRGAVPVWVTLFPDSLVMFSESPYGSRKEFACSIFDDLSVSSEGMDDVTSTDKRLIVSLKSQAGEESQWTLRSDYPASLVACERKLHGAIEKRNFLMEQAAQARRNSASLAQSDPQAALGR